MTVVHPNSISGINSITVQSGQSLSIHDSGGNLLREIVSNTGFSTVSGLSVGSAVTAKDYGVHITGVTTVTGKINIGDATNDSGATNAIEIGAGPDLKLYHDGSNSFITDTGTGSLITRTSQYLVYNAAGTELMIAGNTDGNVELYHNGTKRIETTSTGVALDSLGATTTLQIISDTESSIDFNDHGGSAKRYKIGTNISDNSGQFEIKDMTANAERLRITSAGKVLIGTTATPTQSGALNVFGVDDTTSQVSIRRGSADAGAPKIHFQKSRNTTDGSHTVLQSGDVLGQIVFAGNDGAGPENGALISAEVDGTPGGNDMPGRLVFSTTPDGSDTLAERLRIDKNGDMCLGGTPFSQGTGNTFCIHSSGTGGGDHSYIYFTNGDSGHSASNGMSIGIAANQVANIAVREAWPFAISTNGSERVRIHSNGNISMGFSNDSYELSIQGQSGGPTLWLRDSGTSGSPRLMFGDTGNAGQGAIYYKNSDDNMYFYTGGDLTNAALQIASDAQVHIRPQNGGNNNTSISFTNTNNTPIISFRSNNVSDAASIKCGESSGGAHLTLSTKNTDGNLRTRYDITNDGNTYTGSYAGSNRTYPIIGGAPMGSSGHEAGQVNWHDIQSPSGTIGGWVELGLDYNSAHPWPARAYKIAQHENGINGTRVYQIWHNGDANYDYGGLWEVRINEWGSSSNRFESASLRLVNGNRTDIKLLCYDDTNGIWVQPNTIWGSLHIRRSGWDNSCRARSSSYCAVANGGALAYGDTAGANGSIPSGSGKFELYCYEGSGGSHTGGRDIENANSFNG